MPNRNSLITACTLLGMLSISATALCAPAAQNAAPLRATASDPAPNANVQAPLSMIHVMFNGQVDPKNSGFEVTTADGKRVDVGQAMPMGSNMLMAMPQDPLPAGTYKVKWHTAGPDTKTVEGEFSFTVK